MQKAIFWRQDVQSMMSIFFPIDFARMRQSVSVVEQRRVSTWCSSTISPSRRGSIHEAVDVSLSLHLSQADEHQYDNPVEDAHRH